MNLIVTQDLRKKNKGKFITVETGWIIERLIHRRADCKWRIQQLVTYSYYLAVGNWMTFSMDDNLSSGLHID